MDQKCRSPERETNFIWTWTRPEGISTFAGDLKPVTAVKLALKLGCTCVAGGVLFYKYGLSPPCWAIEVLSFQHGHMEMNNVFRK